MLDGVNDFSSCKASEMPAHTKTPCVMTKNGKATINVPTNSKDEAKFHIAHIEKLLIQDDKNDNLLK